MDKYFLSLTILLLLNICNNTEVGEIINLPEPKKEGGMPLYEAIRKRQSLRNFDPSIKVSLETLSQALWSCYGYSDGKRRTVPSAKAWYNLITYVFLEDGVYKYNPGGHLLIKLIDGDHREMTGTQTALVTKAAVNFVFFGDLKKKTIIVEEKKKRVVFLDDGHVSMVLSLFAAANDMKGVVRGMVDVDALKEFLKLKKEDYEFALAFSLGY